MSESNNNSNPNPIVMDPPEETLRSEETTLAEKKTDKKKTEPKESNKSEDSDQRTNLDEKLLLPPSDQYEEFLKSIPIAELSLKGTPPQIADGQAKIAWVGEPHAVCYIGYPFLGVNVVYSQENPDKVIRRDQFVLNIGIPIHVLYYSNEHQAFVCVRSDVYELA
jgi:hypothetical protein